ncbi:MAG: hypothetical protein ACR2NP_11345, partial [Pirellulaceae bacterium]
MLHVSFPPESAGGSTSAQGLQVFIPNVMKSAASIWKLLVQSGLVTSAQVSEIRTRFDAAIEGREKPGLVDVLNWLKDEKRISSYQMRVLARGVAGPFRFENYR